MPSDPLNNPRFLYQRLIGASLLVWCGIGLTVEPIAAYLSGIGETLGACIWVATGTLWFLARYLCRIKVPGRLRSGFLSLTIVATVIGLYICNGGIVGTIVDPGLFAFGFGVIMTLDGSRFSMISGILNGVLLIGICTIWFPDTYFGASTMPLLPHAAFHILWWSLPMVSGHVIGRQIQAIIDALATSRKAVVEAQQGEVAAAMLAKTAQERAAAERIGTLSEIAATFDGQMQGSVQSLLSLSNTLEGEAAAAQQAALGAHADGDAVASLAGSASEESRSVAVATEQLSQNIERVREQIAAAAVAGQTALRVAADSDTALQTLQGSAMEVDTVVEMIRRIANQTNMLAINAAIEAAHAGEVGQGFAVVAGEVKRLASQTTAATAEVGKLVTAIKAALRDVIGAMGQVGGSATTVFGITEAIALAMDEQAHATSEIAGTVSSVARRTAATSDRVGALISQIRATSDANQAMLAAAAAMRASSVALQTRSCEFAGQLKVC